MHMLTRNNYVVCLLFYSNAIIANAQTVNVRLVGGADAEGTVEIQYNGTWGTICDDSWDARDAIVICRMLGYSGNAEAFSESRFGSGSGPIWVDNTECDGDELSITACRQNGWGIHNCDALTHKEDAGVRCIGTVTLAAISPVTPTTGGLSGTPVFGNTLANCTPSSVARLVDAKNVPTVAYGRLEVNVNGTWGTVCDDIFDTLDAVVACRMLCFGATNALAIGSPLIGNGTGRIWLDNVQCTGSEVDIFNCDHAPLGVSDCSHAEDITLTCVDISNPVLQPPNPNMTCTQSAFVATLRKQSPLQENLLGVFSQEFASNVCLQKTSNDSHIFITVPYNGCGTQRLLNSTHITYNNILYQNASGSGNIYKRSEYRINMNCTFLRTATVANEYQPEVVTIPSIVGSQTFILALYLYENDTFVEKVTSFPYKLTLGEWINIAVELSTTDPGLKLVVPSCKAYSPITLQEYQLITNKCRQDSTLTFFPLNDTKLAYSFQSFKFFGNNESFVYLQCNAVVCSLDEKTAQCDRSCITTGRRKRETEIEPHGISGVTYTVRSGLLDIEDIEGDDNKYAIKQPFSQAIKPHFHQYGALYLVLPTIYCMIL